MEAVPGAAAGSGGEGSEPDHRGLQERLQENAHFLQLILDTIPSPVFYKDCDLRYLGCNRAMEAFLGQTREQLLGKTTADVASAEFAAVYQAADVSLLASQGAQTYQTQISTGWGGVREVVLHKAVFSTLQGQVGGMVGVIQDVTEREEAARALAKNRALLEALLEQSPSPILAVAWPGAEIIICNGAARQCLGIEDEATYLGRTLEQISLTWSLLDPAGRPLPLSAFPLVRDAPRSGEFTLQRKDGSQRQCMAFGVPILDAQGTPTAGLVIFPDITEQRRAEEALRRAQKLESLGTMAGGIAHDFNNLFQGLQSLLECLRVQTQGETVALLDRALGVLERGAALTGQILDFTGHSHRRLETMRPDTLVREAVDGVAGKGDHPTAFQVTPAPGLPGVEVDRSQMNRALEALLITQAQGAESGQQPLVEISLALVGAEEAGREDEGVWMVRPGSEPQVAITIRHRGPGLPAPVLNRLFEPFFTATGAKGLGLPATLGILRGHGAGLHVRSQDGEGTCFRVYLPVRPAQEAPKPGVSAAQRPRTVLFVDDDPLLREVLGQTIQVALGQPLLTAIDGVEALEVFKAHAQDIDLVILDATMPRLSGPEAFEAMRRLRPDLRGLLCSGFSERFGTETARSHGFQAFLAKPFSLQQLLEAVGLQGGASEA